MKILSSKLYKRMKATVQSTGKLGFSGAASTALQLSPGKYIRFAQDTDETLYLAVMDCRDNDGFKLLQSGGYYSLSTRALFDALNVDYKNHTVIYDLERDASKDDIIGGRVCRMKPRILAKTKK